MSRLELAMPTIFLHEGRYAHLSGDPGGPTNYGWSLRALMKMGDIDGDGWLDGDINRDGVVDINDVKAIDDNEAEHLYDIHYWTKYGYGRIDDQAVATKILDLSANMGDIGGHKCIQRAIRAAEGWELVDDGILGPKTLKAINSSDPKILLPTFKSEAAGYYRSIRYEGSKNFLKGWLNRAYGDMVRPEDLKKH